MKYNLIIIENLITSLSLVNQITQLNTIHIQFRFVLPPACYYSIATFFPMLWDYFTPVGAKVTLNSRGNKSCILLSGYTEKNLTLDNRQGKLNLILIEIILM
jgi:hypothetical protein